jgi:hypothetical protein
MACGILNLRVFRVIRSSVKLKENAYARTVKIQ